MSPGNHLAMIRYVAIATNHSANLRPVEGTAVGLELHVLVPTLPHNDAWTALTVCPLHQSYQARMQWPRKFDETHPQGASFQSEMQAQLQPQAGS